MKALNTLRLAFNTVRWNISGNFADVQRDYDQAASTYDSYYGRYLGSITDQFADKIPLKGQERILELAAGTGRLTSAVCKRLKPEAHLTAVDLSEGMLAVNKAKNGHGEGPRVDFWHGDALDAITERSNESLDAVLCAWGVCYFNHDTLRTQVERVLRPGGILAIIENRKCTLAEVSALFEQLIVSQPRYLRKAIKINLPEDAGYLVKKFCQGQLEQINSWNGTLDIPYESASEVREYMLKSGASAGFLDAIEPAYLDEFLHAFEQLVAAQKKRVPLTHQFSVLLAQKA
ncbi:MAG TPA: class I SAM-dependent methyltransferase [Aquabacterium sp.]|uniref:class I SAM-dependent methyltransferase n=1 Tax=Aquabacterium sp. TaxID=1872578 RepID=UPI002E34A4E9|nr:class I SAM-dependent methyltransferase [Aquabacterium sp.]HEX5357097.1 class I SAM-dependent methyltransferase [Aquabacterium sp.]